MLRLLDALFGLNLSDEDGEAAAELVLTSFLLAGPANAGLGRASTQRGILNFRRIRYRNRPSRHPHQRARRL